MCYVFKMMQQGSYFKLCAMYLSWCSKDPILSYVVSIDRQQRQRAQQTHNQNILATHLDKYPRLAIFNWNLLKFKNLSILTMAWLTKIFRNVFWTLQIKWLQVPGIPDNNTTHFLFFKYKTQNSSLKNSTLCNIFFYLITLSYLAC